MISLVFPHRPVPWSRTVRGDRTPRRLKQDKYINDLALTLKLKAKGETFDGPVLVRLEFDYHSNLTLINVDSAAKHHLLRSKRPDIDNLCKMVLEALQKSGIVKDDSQVAILEAEKTE